MENNNFKRSVFIGLTFLAGMMLTILPLPKWAVWYQPVWIFMSLLFWMITIPYQVGIGTTFIVGLLLDLLTGTILGQHALIFTRLAYFFIRFQIIIHSLPAWQQMILVLITTVVYLALQYWIMVIVGSSLLTGKYWMPS
ncbi:rod shape-determining protein MreD [Coxiella endosymbiont of Dermacentor marginatus]|uniref:rod shape-determining protein MreD n=1 Tax=Coxiella endosymbiont of Dermacentor marginatus TaxID=1656159 RepID=UPI0022237A5A|nr:rod shape-determining protein MreD [Coxiella endosymbiont of Dermacentor marginatus]